MRLITKILLGLGTVIMLTAATTALNVEGLNWFKANQLEKKTMVRIPSEQIIAGDSTVIYKGGPALLTSVNINYVPYLTAYTTTGNTDTVKIYSTYNNIPVQVGYILDDLYESSIRTLSGVSSSIGGVDGTLYYIKHPSGKFTVGDAYLDIVCDWVIFR